MAENRCVVYQGPGEVTIEDIGYPKLEVPEYVASNMGFNTQEAHHGVILRIVSTNICGSDQHMVRGRTTAPQGQTLGHEITGEVIEVGNDVQFIIEDTSALRPSSAGIWVAAIEDRRTRPFSAAIQNEERIEDQIAEIEPIVVDPPVGFEASDTARDGYHNDALTITRAGKHLRPDRGRPGAKHGALRWTSERAKSHAFYKLESGDDVDIARQGPDSHSRPAAQVSSYQDFARPLLRPRRSGTLEERQPREPLVCPHLPESRERPCDKARW